MSPGELEPSRRSTSTVVLASGALVLCLLVTGTIVISPRLLLGGHTPSLHLVLDSVDTCVAVLVAYLLVGRFRRDTSLRSLLLACGLLLLAAGNAAGAAMPSTRPFTLEVWYPLSLRISGTLGIAVGSLVHQRVVGRGATAAIAIGTGLVPVAILGVLWPLRDGLPVALTSAPLSALTPIITGHPALILGHALGAAAFLLAAAAFTRHAERVPDEMLRWFAPACVLGAFSRVHYMLFPSIYSGWLYTGDLLRTGCYLLLLVGAAREIGRYWQDQPRLAVVADRRRLARELHDGVAQELTYIVAESPAIDDPATRERITEAAYRGLDETRAAIEALDRGQEESLGLQLHRAARQLTDRYGVPVVVDLDVSVRTTAEQAHALVRIAREAVSNAIRHGGARHIGIRLTRDEQGPALVVHDDGRGFDPALVKSTGYGVTSMRDRAAGLPGALTIESAIGRGTTVGVSWRT